METPAMSLGIPIVLLVTLTVSGLVYQSVQKGSEGATSGSTRESFGGLLLRVPRALRTLGLNALNTGVYVLSFGTVTLHQGRYLGWLRRWVNWNRVISCRPGAFERPRDERELRECLERARTRVRIVGSGHSFNAAPTTRETQVSLARYRLEGGQWLVWTDKPRGIVRVAAGMRLRDLMRALWKEGWTFPVLGSADAQSLAGLIATDVHGTGRDHGFLSEQVLALKLMDSLGNLRTVRGDTGDAEEAETFRATLGGMGACGVVLEVELRCVPRFNLEKSSWLMQRDWVDRHLEDLVREHAHVSFYELGGTRAEHVRMNVWKPTGRAPSALLRVRRILFEVLDMAVSGFLFELTLMWRCQLEFIGNLALFLFKLGMDGKRSVHPAATGFTRTLYFRHDELEYGVPFENYLPCIQELRQLLWDEKFLSVIEVRFTPAHHSPALLGPGAGHRRTCFIELAPTVSYGRRRLDAVFERATEILQRHGGRAHLGKQVPAVGPEELLQMHGERFTTFQRVRDRRDPTRRFTNDFTRRVLGP